MFSWGDFGRKEEEGKEIGRKGSHLPCLVGEKNREREVKQCTRVCGSRMNSAKSFFPTTGQKIVGTRVVF